MEEPFRSLAGRYNEVVAPHVQPVALMSGAIAPAMGTRISPGGRGGVSSRATPGGMHPTMDPAAIAPVVPADHLALLSRDMPASARTTNPTHNANRLAKPIVLGDCVDGLTAEERVYRVPLPQPREMVFIFHPPGKTSDAVVPVYSIKTSDVVTRVRELARHLPSQRLLPTIGSEAQEMRLISPAGVNYVLALMERKVYLNAKDAQDYRKHLFDNPARSTFERMFSYDGVVDTVGNVANLGTSSTKQQPQLMSVTTAGMSTCNDYLRGCGNVEGARVIMVIARRPVRSDKMYNLAYHAQMNSAGEGHRIVQFATNNKLADTEEFNGQMWPIQIDIFGQPTGDPSPLLTAPFMAPPGCLHGAAAVPIGRVFFRNIGDLGQQPILPVMQSTAAAPHTTDPPKKITDLQGGGLDSTLETSKKRPITIQSIGARLSVL